jgi:hypothetical protein
MSPKLNVVPFVSVDSMMKLVHAIGVERFLVELADFIETDFKRRESFDKTPRVASHSAEGVIELMPTSDGEVYGFKYVNGHPKNTKEGRQTVTAFGVLADVRNGYPLPLTEMTILTALRTASTSALAAQSRLRRMAVRLRRRQDDHRAPRPAHPSLRDRRDRQRELALQEPRLNRKPPPRTPPPRVTPVGAQGCLP